MSNEQAWSIQMNSARQKMATQNKKKSSKKNPLVGKVENIMQEPSKKTLRICWLSSITSYGLTLLYIEFHFIMRYLGGPLSRFFCRFGEEGLFGLTPPLPKGTPLVSKGAEYAELIVILVLNLLIVLIILIIIVMICLIGWILTEPIEVVNTIGIGAIWELIRSYLATS